MSEDCIIWTKGATGSGYPAMKRDGRTVYVKRDLWESHRGPIPEGMTVRSRCGNRLCVNVAHLYLDRSGRLNAPLVNGRFAKTDPKSTEVTPASSRGTCA